MSTPYYLINTLEKHQEFTLEELVEQTNRLIPIFVEKQKRYKVSDEVNKRTIRYYVSMGLINKPIRYKARKAVYSPVHVLQILAVKSFQSKYIPLKKIAQLMATLSFDDLKSLLLLDEPVPFSLPGMLRLPQKEEKPYKKIEPESGYPVPNLLPRVESPIIGNVWHRFHLHDKLELNVEGNFDILGRDVDIKEIFTRFMQILAVASQSHRLSPQTSMESIDFDNLDLTYARPTSPLRNQSEAVIALVTEGGLVPKDNPDQLESAKASRYLRYSIQGMDDLRSGEFESIDRGWDNVYVNADPDRLLPVDVMRELENEHLFSRLYPEFYTTTGAGTPVDQAKKIGKEMAEELKERNISAVILTAT